ncbi:MAG: hypothetical protein ACLFQB_14960 [Chitinispirillaceae bacterium]
MKFLIPLFTAALAAAGTYYYLQNGTDKTVHEQPDYRVEIAHQTVRTRLDDLNQEIENRLSAFAEVLQTDREFSMKLLLEKDPNSQKVKKTAQRFIKPLGFSFLEITDENGEILSSGHFPASAGQSSKKKVNALNGSPSTFLDKFRGEQILTYQAKKAFQLLESRLNVIGGIRFNEEFLEELGEYASAKVILKDGMTIIGKDDIHSISEMRDKKIIINNREYDAASIPLPSADGADRTLIILPEHQFR